MWEDWSINLEVFGIEKIKTHNLPFSSILGSSFCTSPTGFSRSKPAMKVGSDGFTVDRPGTVKFGRVDRPATNLASVSTFGGVVSIGDSGATNRRGFMILPLIELKKGSNEVKPG